VTLVLWVYAMPLAHKGWHSRGYLPHFDVPCVIQFITFRLADSLPASAQLQRELEGLPERPGVRLEHIDTLLDAGLGSCILRDPGAARIVEDALLHFDGTRYRLLAWVVMPNHVHVVIEVLAGHSLSRTVQSWKTFSARACNQLLDRRGRLWEPDYFDRRIRTEEHLHNVILYVHQNPARAGLVAEPRQWPSSSARYVATPDSAFHVPWAGD